MLNMIELIGLESTPPEFGHSSFINPAVMAVVNNVNLERIILQGLQISDKGHIPPTDVQQLIQLSNEVRQASRKGQKGFQEIVVYLGKKRYDSKKAGAIPFVGEERSVPIPFAGKTNIILDDLSSQSDIIIVHLHPSSPEASDEDLKALQDISRALSLESGRTIKASLLIIGERDHEEILHTFDSKGKYMSINLEDLVTKEQLSQPLLDRLFILKYKGNRFDQDADIFKPTWYGDSKLYPPEIPGTGLLFPGYLNAAPPFASIPDKATLEEISPPLFVNHATGEAGKLPVIYTEKDGGPQLLKLQHNGRQYVYLLNGIPYYSSPTSLFPTTGEKISIARGGIKIADYQFNLTGGKNIHKVEILAIPTESL